MAKIAKQSSEFHIATEQTGCHLFQYILYIPTVLTAGPLNPDFTVKTRKICLTSKLHIKILKHLLQVSIRNPWAK